ncbi:MAG: UDP-N-acetylmuramoyl-L-alanine--D-glutamate ligase [Wenzhouxiangellaceae bacterium]|nr:UDP-N-acetylmuramoyl-L-alanine--D-glutamate ligase [Wenzhouxiangellaceae bacterium]
MRLADLATGPTLVLGFGREARSLERVVLERVPGARVEVVCDKPPEIAPGHWPVHVSELSAFAANDAGHPARVLRSPGVPVESPVLAAWRERGVPVTCISSLWFGERPDARVIAVTGSKGKSTTAALIAHLLRAAGFSVELAGNIGRPVLNLVDAKPDWFVLELSSYQLADLDGRADVGVITRLFPEHQDWHGGVDAYYAAKLRLVELLNERPLWTNAADRLLENTTSSLPGVRSANRAPGIHARDDGVFVGDRRLLARADSPLTGRHNLDNIALALAVVASLGADVDILVRALSDFAPLPHRIEPVAAADSRTWIDDSISTTPFSALAALESCRTPPVLIVGGLERGADWSEVAGYCRRRPLAGLVALPDNGPRIVSAILDAGGVAADRVAYAENMEAAVRAAANLCPPGGCVLLSPGAPSFPHFRDFEQRGEAFAEAVKVITAE